MSEESLERQYQAVQQAAGIFDLSARGKLEVEGPDHVEFLHSMITNEVRALARNSGRYGAFLTHNGKLVSDFYYYRLQECVLLDLTPGRASVLREALERFIIMDDVTVVDRSEDLAHFALHGPLAPEILSACFASRLPEDPLELVEAPEGELLIRKPQFTPDGYEIVLARAQAPGLIREILHSFGDRGVTLVEERARNVLRLERGIPCFGLDMDETNYPMEAGLDDAVSLTKGCFVGQEVVSKATHIGGVRRRLKKLLMQAGAPIPLKGDKVFKGEQAVGAISSAATSIRLQQPIALAYLIQARVSSGDDVTVETKQGKSSARIVDQFERPES